MLVKFVNRHKEFEFLKTQSNFSNKKSNTVLICGESGIGKSELTKNFLSQNKNLMPSIKVSIQQAEKNAYSAGYYITKLAKALHICSENDERVRSLSKFLKQRKSSEIVFKRVTENLVADLVSTIPLSNSIKIISDIALSKGEFDLSKFFESTDSDILITLYDYVRAECKRTPLTINMENIQSMDSYSLELLIKIIKDSTNCLYILEFTDNDNSGYTFSEIITEFENNEIKIETLPVLPLTINDVKKVIEDHPNVTWDLIQNSYVNWNGNMRLLVDLLAKLKYGLPLELKVNLDLNSATYDHLNLLSGSELFILTVIQIHKEPVQKSLLDKILLYKEAFQFVFDLQSILQKLEEHSLIKYLKDEIVLAHDSIEINLIKVDKYNLFSIIGQRFWLDTYERLLISEDVFTSRGWRLMKVLYFVSLLNLDSKIYSLLSLINEEALRSRDPEKMISYVQDVKIGLIQKDSIRYKERINQINFWLVELYYKIGNAKKAWKNLSEIDQYSKKFSVLKAILLEQIGNHSEAITFCSHELELSNEENLNYNLSLSLVRLVTYFDIGEIELTKREFEKLYKIKKYRNILEYGFLLRNAELVFSYKDSLPYYKKSITHFKKHNAIRQAAFSRITYGVHLGLVGNYKEAKKQFNLAEKELGNVISERHSLLNNLAVLLIFQKKINSNADELLRQAMLTASSDFERLTITMNFLVFMDWKDNRQEVEGAINIILLILKKPTFASKEIIRYAFYNIYKYYKRIGNVQLTELYRNKIDELNLTETPIWKFWLYNEPISEEDEEFHLSVIDRSISFLCNWNMEYDSSLMHYE
jgi:tetratricopeptide (TPR) repeat protein